MRCTPLQYLVTSISRQHFAAAGEASFHKCIRAIKRRNWKIICHFCGSSHHTGIQYCNAQERDPVAAAFRKTLLLFLEVWIPCKYRPDLPDLMLHLFWIEPPAAAVAKSFRLDIDGAGFFRQACMPVFSASNQQPLEGQRYKAPWITRKQAWIFDSTTLSEIMHTCRLVAALVE